MTIALAILSLIIVGLSLYGVLLPDRLIRFVRGFMQDGAGLWVAIGIRLLLAVLLWFSSPLSRTPALFNVLAVLMLLTAVALPLVGRVRLNKFLAHVASCPTWAVRLLCLLGVVLGGVLIWSISLPPGAS